MPTSNGANGALPFRGRARYAVLALLSFGDELTGYALHKRTELAFRSFFGNIALSQVYRELNQLEALGWVASAEPASTDRPGRTYRLTDEGHAGLQAWASSARFDPPTLRFPVSLKVWLGHLTDVDELREAIQRQDRYVDDMLEMIQRIDEGARDDDRWTYPAIVNRWSRRIWEATLQANAELVSELEAVAAAGRGQPTAARPVHVRAAEPAARTQGAT